MKNKIISTMLAATIVCGTIPVQSVERQGESITAESLISENNKLQDGTYTIPVTAKNESKPEEDSTANKYLNNTSNLYIKDGKMFLELKFKDAAPIKEIGVKVNDAEPDECDIQGVGSGDITLIFSIDSLDDTIVLPMKISPMSFITVNASAIIELDKSELRDENGDIVDLGSIPGNGGDIDSEPGDDGSDDNESNDSDTETDDGSEENGSDKNLSDILEEGLVYTVENKALNETSSAESLARQFLDSTSKLEVENGTTYVTIKFLGRSLMSNQKILVNNVETPYEVINESENASNYELDIKFPITSLNDKIKISMYVSAINQNVAFRLQFDKTTVKDPDGNSVNVESGSVDKIEDAPELDLTVNKKYKSSNIVRGSNGNTTPIIANYIEEYSIVEVVDNNLYVYITFTNSSVMTYRELTVNGVKQNFSSTVNSNGSYTIKVKLNSINDEMEFTNLLTKSISDGFKIRVNGNTLVEYKEESNGSNSSSDSSDDDDLDDGKYTIKNKVLKEDSDSESIARDYVDTESEIEVKNNKMYLTLKFTKGSLMSNISVKVNDKKVSHEVVKKSGDKYYIKFKIGSLSDEVLVSSRIMNSMDVKFRVLLRSSTIDEIDSDEDESIENDDELSGPDSSDSDNINDNTSGSEGNNAGGTGSGNISSGSDNASPGVDSSTTESYTRTTYSIKNKVICDSQIGYQAARDAINELSYLEHENNKIYLTLNLQKTDLMSNIRVSVNGNEVKYNTFNKNASAKTMSIKFEIPNENPNITIKTYIGMISRDISFDLNLLQDTKTFIKSEEINASQLENISSGSGSSNDSGSSNNSSGDSSSSVDEALAGEGSSADMSTVTEQLANSTIEASEYFKRYTINNEVISDSSMGKMMARKYLNEISILEEIDGQFYITVTFTGTGAMDNFRFSINGADVQYEIILDDSANGIKSFRFPISSVNDSIQAYIFIKPVKMNIDFGIKLLEDTMVLIEEGTVEDGTLDQDSSLLSDIVDKATKNSSTGEVSPVKIAISTSTLTIVLNQLVNLLTSYLKNRKKKISISK